MVTLGPSPLLEAAITGGWYLAAKGRCCCPARPGRRELPAQPPVAANQPTFGAPNTNTMGAMQGWGRLTVALMSEFPAVLAGNGAVLTLVTVAAPVALMVWQLTMASKPGMGLVPCSAGGTGAWSARTRPRTCTRR